MLVINYLAYIFLSHLPLVIEEKRVIDSKEETCLVLPVKENQIKKGRQGNWMFMCRLAELPPNEKMQTHDIQLSYLTEEDLQKSYDFGYHRRTAHMGRVYEHDRTPEKKIDRTNHATDIRCDGVIVLSDIPKSKIFANAENAKRYISGLTFKALQEDGIIYTGSICLDDIPRDDVQTQPDTGKKFVTVRFKKLERLDTYMNTHQLVIARNDGSEIEIGRFKEWKKEGYEPEQQQPTQNPEEIHNTGVNQRIAPDYIGGIKF